MAKPIRYEAGWRIATKIGGKQVRRRFPDVEYGDSDKAITAAVGFLERLRPTNTPPAPVLGGPTIAESVREFIRWSEQDKHKSPAWVATSAQMLSVAVDAFARAGGTTLRGLSLEHMRAFRREFAASVKRSDSTWEKYRQATAAWLNWAHKRDPEIVNIAADDEFKISVLQKAPETFDRAEVRQLLDYYDSQDGVPPFKGAAFRLLFYAGLRRGEMVDLKWSNVDFKRKVIVTGTKTKKQRTIPLAPEIIAWLKRLPRETIYVLDDGRGNPLYHKKAWYMMLQQALAVLKLKRRGLHSTRHTFVRFLLEGGVELTLVRDLCGHADIRTTMRYAQHYSLTNAREAVSKLKF